MTDVRELPDAIKAIATKHGGAEALARAAVAGADIFDPAVQDALLAAAADMPTIVRPKAPEPCVYFIRCGDWVKIGTTATTPERRFRGMQLPPNAELVAVMFGHGTATEAELHQRFHAQRVRGEWFTTNADLDALLIRHAYTPRC